MNDSPMNDRRMDDRRASGAARPFGLQLSTASGEAVAAAALEHPRAPEDGVALVVTPNIDHVARLRHTPELATAYRHAELIVCDGWPVRFYARLRGLDVQPVTGCELAARLMRPGGYAPWQRLFFVVDSPRTEAALRAWAATKGIAERTASFVPPFGFEHDEALCRSLAEAVRAHGTTLLIMAVGAPRSEIFVDRLHDALPSCWAFCVGQAVKIEVGLVRRAPPGIQAIGLEWLWRVAQEPRRLARRYVVSSVGFALAVLEDLRSPRAAAAAAAGEAGGAP
ncbi:MAG: WecB/TagA/CpsF family glycosyltransferase [Pseudomonadota bacterium]|nr:WecB/TagA/CpsF family glycosyltransferase [Pseudomonadota bacterium]